jgi:tRNA (mo5U34)-methyltransferase
LPPPAPVEPWRAELLAEVARYQWMHRIDLGGGHTTPGQWPQSHIVHAFNHVDFSGKKVLDIGCWDGLWSFQAEMRGAREVYATDLLAQRWGGEQPTFQLAAKLLDSKARYFPNVSVYDVHELGVRDFDVVIFTGIYYHLKDPLLALARLRQVMADGGILILEGEAIDSPESFARFYYRQGHNGDWSNWWVPTVPCLRGWVDSSFFDIGFEHAAGGYKVWRRRWKGFGRYVLLAEARRPAPPARPFDRDSFARYDFLEEEFRRRDAA